MMEGKRPPQEKRFFVPKLKLDEIRTEIARLEAKAKNAGLKGREEAKLSELKKIPRREMLKKSALAAAGVGAAFGAFKVFQGGKPESRERVTPLAGAQGIIEEYNVWLDSLDSNFSEDEIVDKFVEIYNSWIKRMNIETELPEIPKDLTAVKVLTAVQPLRDALEQQGYFFSVAPTQGVWKNRQTGFVAILLGKIERKENRTASDGKKKQDYEYILVGAPDPNDPNKQYKSSPSRFTAETRREKGRLKLIQFNEGYENSAETIFRDLQTNTRDARDLARQAAFGEYRSSPNGTQEIQRLLIQSSFEHEEQHVLDGVKEITEQLATAENAAISMVSEIRGLIKPLHGSKPKVGLYNIFNWAGQSGALQRLVGGTLTSILRDVSGREFESLYSLSDSELRIIGERAMKASDIFYQWVVVEKKPLDASLNDAYYKYLETIKK